MSEHHGPIKPERKPSESSWFYGSDMINLYENIMPEEKNDHFFNHNSIMNVDQIIMDFSGMKNQEKPFRSDLNRLRQDSERLRQDGEKLRREGDRMRSDAQAQALAARQEAAEMRKSAQKAHQSTGSNLPTNLQDTLRASERRRLLASQARVQESNKNLFEQVSHQPETDVPEITPESGFERYRHITRTRKIVLGAIVATAAFLLSTLAVLGVPGEFLAVAAIAALGSLVLVADASRRNEVASSMPAPTKKEVRSARQERLDTARTRAEKIVELYTSYLFDACAVVRRPALNDLGIPQTQVFVQAYHDLTAVDWKVGVTDLEHFEKLVSQAEITWRAADQNATRVASSYFTLEEQKRLTQAEQLLKLALSPASTSPERKLAYERALLLLQGLVELHETARLELTSQVGLALEAALLRKPDAPPSAMLA